MELPLLQVVGTTISARGYRLLPSSVVSANSYVQQVRVLDNLADEMERKNEASHNSERAVISWGGFQKPNLIFILR